MNELREYNENVESNVSYSENCCIWIRIYNDFDSTGRFNIQPSRTTRLGERNEMAIACDGEMLAADVVHAYFFYQVYNFGEQFS